MIDTYSNIVLYCIWLSFAVWSQFETMAGCMLPEAGYFWSFTTSLKHFLGKWPVQRHFYIQGLGMYLPSPINVCLVQPMVILGWLFNNTFIRGRTKHCRLFLVLLRYFRLKCMIFVIWRDFRLKWMIFVNWRDFRLKCMIERIFRREPRFSDTQTPDYF